MARGGKWEINCIDLACGDSIFVEETKYAKDPTSKFSLPTRDGY